MKNAKLVKTILWGWLGVSGIIFFFLCYNYVNSLNIIYYQVDAWPITSTLTFTIDEVSNSIVLYKLVHGIAILYTIISSMILLYLLKSQAENKRGNMRLEVGSCVPMKYS